MSKYLSAQICLNGHTITWQLENMKNIKTNFCTKCGAETITSCPSCKAAIRGMYSTDSGSPLTTSYRVPAYCHKCGAAYPWTESALSAMDDLIHEDEALSIEDKERLSQSLPDLIAETPRTALAAARVKKMTAKALAITSEHLLQFLLTHACSKARELLGL